MKGFVSELTADASSSLGGFVHDVTVASVGYREADERAIERDCLVLQDLVH